MKIDSMDASLPMTTTQETKPVQRDNSAPKTVNPVIEKSISQMTDYEKKELPISDKVVIDAIEKANKAISGANKRFEFSIHEKTKEIMVKVIDSDTNQVIREIPPEKILDLVARMWEMAGIVIDERR